MFHPYAACNAPSRAGWASLRQRNTIDRTIARPAGSDAGRKTHGIPQRISRLVRRSKSSANDRENWYAGGMDVCLILSQRIERNKPRRESHQRGGGRFSSAISKTIEFPAISKPQAVRSFIHASIQVPAPTTPRDHVQNSSARPPIRPLCHLPFLYQDHPHPRSRAPPPPNVLRRLVVGGLVVGAIPSEYTLSR